MEILGYLASFVAGVITPFIGGWLWMVIWDRNDDVSASYVSKGKKIKKGDTK